MGSRTLCALEGRDVVCHDLCKGAARVEMKDVREFGYAGFDACAVAESGQVSCWTPFDWSGPKPVREQHGASRLWVGERSACAAEPSGSVKCWFIAGDYPWAAAADPSAASSHDAHKMFEPPNGSYADVAPGALTACFVRHGGAVLCSGANWAGQVGPSPSKWMSRPAPVPLAAPATQVVTTADFSCGLLRNGQVACWGDSRVGGWTRGGALGRRGAPSLVTSVSGATGLVASMTSVCALTPNDVKCWGSFTLPNGVTAHHPTSLLLGPIRELALGPSRSACAVLSNGNLFCWGYESSCGL